MRKIYIYLLLFISILFVKCKNNVKETSTNEDKQEAKLPQEFLDFLTEFESDSVYQITHIVFPLEGAIRAPKEEEDTLDSVDTDSTNVEVMIPYKWRKNKWKLHSKFNNYDNIFTRKYIAVSEDLIIEKTSGVNGLFQMERRFAKMSDGWNLIYYSVN